MSGMPTDPTKLTNMKERLQWAREYAGYDEATAAAIEREWVVSTYLAHENGTRGFRREADKYARAYKVDLEWLITGKGHPLARRSRLADELGSLPPQARAEIESFIEYVKQKHGIGK